MAPRKELFEEKSVILAPLIENEKVPKHYRMPLMEPSISGDLSARALIVPDIFHLCFLEDSTHTGDMDGDGEGEDQDQEDDQGGEEDMVIRD